MIDRMRNRGIIVKSAFGVLLVFSASFPLSAQWQRMVFSGKGEGVDAPSPQPLSYFTANPFLRDDGDDLCVACTPGDKANSGQRYTIQTAVKPVGRLAGYRIIDILCYLGPRGGGEPVDVKWKFILVQVGANRYREIFHLQAFYTTVSISPSRIIRSGNEAVLATMDADGGNGGGCWEGYWWFNSTGPHSLDFSHLQAAIKNRIPKNTVFATSCAHLHFDTQEIRSGVQKSEARCHACDWVGDVTARFRLVGPIVEPVKIRFQPAQPWPPDPVGRK
jgi:hypothetical protein